MSVKILAAAALLIAMGAAGQVTAQPEAESAPKAGVHEVQHDTGLYDFNYAYPDEVEAIPALRDHFEKQIAKAEAQLQKEARDSWASQKEFAERSLAEAGADEQADAREALANIEKYAEPYRANYLAVGWEAAADLPRWLSLAATIETYSGGAHGNQGYDSLVWDKQEGRIVEPVDLFVSAAALRVAIQPEFCDKLDAEREERRGEPVKRDQGEMFDECIDPLENTLVLDSENGTAFDTITLLIGPYAAGPYVEGTYEIEIPVTATIIAAVRPEYRASFSAGR